MFETTSQVCISTHFGWFDFRGTDSVFGPATDAIICTNQGNFVAAQQRKNLDNKRTSSLCIKGESMVRDQRKYK